MTAGTEESGHKGLGMTQWLSISMIAITKRNIKFIYPISTWIFHIHWKINI